MPFSYSNGLVLIVWLTIAIAIILFILFLIIFLQTRGKEENLASPFLGATILVSCFAVYIGLVLFVLIFPLYNLLAQIPSYIIEDYFFSEIGNGILFLRLSSFLLGCHVLEITINFLRGNKPPKENSSEHRVLLCYAQYGLYLISVFCLWMCIINNFSSSLVILLNWIVFFILDDWIIISSYYIKIDKILKSHIIRIILLNTVILIIFSITLIYHFKLIWSVIAIIITFIFYLFSFFLFREIYKQRYNQLFIKKKK